jgi:hypothetical protein
MIFAPRCSAPPEVWALRGLRAPKGSAPSLPRRHEQAVRCRLEGLRDFRQDDNPLRSVSGAQPVRSAIHLKAEIILARRDDSLGHGALPLSYGPAESWSQFPRFVRPTADPVGATRTRFACSIIVAVLLHGDAAATSRRRTLMKPDPPSARIS